MQPAQFRAGMQLGFQADVRLKDLKVSNLFKRHDFVTARFVDHQVAGDVEQISSAVDHPFPISNRPGTAQNFGNKIIKVLRGPEDSAQT